MEDGCIGGAMVAEDAIDAAASDQTINERQEWDDFLDNRPNPVSVDDGDEPPPPPAEFETI